MKKLPPPGDDPDKDGFQFADYGVERPAILRRLLELLRPHVATDPLVPAICKHLCADTYGEDGHAITLEFAKMELDACRAQFGPSDHRTVSARVHLRDCKRISDREQKK